MNTKHASRRRPTRLDPVVAFIYEYRHQIAYGLMVAAALLKSWHPIIDITPTIMKSAKPTRTRRR